MHPSHSTCDGMLWDAVAEKWDAVAEKWDAAATTWDAGMLWLRSGMLVAEKWDAVATTWDAGMLGCCGCNVYGIILIEMPCIGD